MRGTHDERSDFFAFERFFDVVVGSASHRFDGRCGRRISGDEEHLRARVFGLCRSQNVEPRHVVEAIIGDDDIVGQCARPASVDSG